jgi:hypothetical protein
MVNLTVIQFYKNDEYSCLCPDRVKKRQALWNLQELYVALCVKHQTISFDFSNYAEICPEDYTLEVPGAKSDTVLIFVICCNITLMIQGIHHRV